MYYHVYKTTIAILIKGYLLNKIDDFSQLSPDIVIDAVERAIGLKMTGLTIPLPSYINRVYELQAMNGTRMIAKFYRPGRWSRGAILDEHEFISDCVNEEIPVIRPCVLNDGSTLGRCKGIYFCVFPKRLGREFEINGVEDWERIGAVVGRIHMAGKKRVAINRVRLHPMDSTARDMAHLVEGGYVTPEFKKAFHDVCENIINVIRPFFDDAEFIRIHGDCHRGNLLDRPDDGIMVIDFDDMMMGPPVHDLWLLLPDHFRHCREELGLILKGYKQFCRFDYNSLRMIEGLRFMRIIYYLAWCSRQKQDYQFQTNHPNWGDDLFWEREIFDLNHQFQVIMEHKVDWEENRISF